MTKKPSSEQLLIGAHTSAAGGPHNALLEGKSIGATTIQLFTANQKQWKGKLLTEETIAHFKNTLQETGLQKIMSHASYLINLASPDEEGYRKSCNAFHEEIGRCNDLGISFLNFHPGAALQAPREEALDRIVQALLTTADLLEEGELRLLFETTAGQGSSLGYTFEELAYLIERTKEHIPVGVCIDTCHIFVAGYDIRSKQGWSETLREFDRIIGLNHLYAFHLNDSVKGLGSKRDRHAPLGEGEIGMDSFQFLMTSEITRNIPKYLETPGGCPLWDKEIWKLREFAR